MTDTEPQTGKQRGDGERMRRAVGLGALCHPAQAWGRRAHTAAGSSRTRGQLQPCRNRTVASFDRGDSRLCSDGGRKGGFAVKRRLHHPAEVPQRPLLAPAWCPADPESSLRGGPSPGVFCSFRVLGPVGAPPPEGWTRPPASLPARLAASVPPAAAHRVLSCASCSARSLSPSL